MTGLKGMDACLGICEPKEYTRRADIGTDIKNVDHAFNEWNRAIALVLKNFADDKPFRGRYAMFTVSPIISKDNISDPLMSFMAGQP